jgi:predicted MFS family arabinose efflux permease
MLFSTAINTIKNDKRIALLGMVQSLFEASMYIFVFMWTPVLEELITEFSDASYGLHGIVFSIYMVCVMLGSSTFSLLIKKYSAETILLFLLFLSVLNNIVIGLLIKNSYVVINCFLILELCVGVYFPTIGTIRSKYIPEESRAAVMNFFRIPLNILVVLILIYINKFENCKKNKKNGH